MRFYVVFIGRVPGIYEKWEDCKSQVHRFSGSKFKAYDTFEEASEAFDHFEETGETPY